ncbi:diacylglycerol kinase [Craterilacuibacter sinensis]|uniref:Diacylglycerol kinase n=1 Tax=Craterilacuibacter sinensis TaxID=2686017 RepID=A0A845BIG4_9NEIS|nr:diacylglycerol kinase [Craterilacuibacter sinensis]MXR36547.1 diacylglycerol kinase [Craterilacuibacter sinensis]
MKSLETSPYKGKTGLRRLFNAFGYSMAGFKAAFVHEDAFRQLTLLALVLVPTACLLEVSTVERVLLIAATLATLIIELFNSAIEAAVDHTSLERHPLAKRAKDMGSAAQFLGLCNLAVVWGLILLT